MRVRNWHKTGRKQNPKQIREGVGVSGMSRTESTDTFTVLLGDSDSETELDMKYVRGRDVLGLDMSREEAQQLHDSLGRMLALKRT